MLKSSTGSSISIATSPPQGFQFHLDRCRQELAVQECAKAWHEDGSSFTSKPRIPKYKHKERGRNILIYDKQAIGLSAFKKTGTLVPSGLPIEIATRITWDQVDQVRIVPRANEYVVEVVYQQEVAQADVDPTMIAALDLGVNTLAACTSTKPGFQPLLINGRLSRASIAL